MLVLSRKAGERIVIGENVTIVVLQSSGDRVKIGIEAPPEIRVHREEVYHRCREAAANETPPRRRETAPLADHLPPLPRIAEFAAVG